MNNEKIEGIGSFQGGEYGEICVDGMGKSKGTFSAETLTVSGTFKSKRKFTVKQFSVNGLARCFADVSAEKTDVNGMLKLRRASLSGSSFFCNGCVTCTKEINADYVDIKGLCSVKSILGDEVILDYDANGMNCGKNGIPQFFKKFTLLYTGRSFSDKHNIVDNIECTALTATHLKAKKISAGSVKLSDGCEVSELVYSDKLEIDDSCVVAKIIKSESGQTIQK